jgi:ribosomal protein S27AE
MSARQHFESIARRWSTAGKPNSMLVDGYRLIALRGWTYSPGGKTEGVSEELAAFVRASEAAQPEKWLDAYLSQRETCSRCGESYRFENVSLCTHCHRTYCYKCASSSARAPNGNATCSCGGELVG